jgi:hypothetical protein
MIAAVGVVVLLVGVVSSWSITGAPGLISPF